MYTTTLVSSRLYVEEEEGGGELSTGTGGSVLRCFVSFRVTSTTTYPHVLFTAREPRVVRGKQLPPPKRRGYGTADYGHVYGNLALRDLYLVPWRVVSRDQSGPTLLPPQTNPDPYNQPLQMLYETVPNGSRKHFTDSVDSRNLTHSPIITQCVSPSCNLRRLVWFCRICFPGRLSCVRITNLFRK